MYESVGNFKAIVLQSTHELKSTIQHELSLDYGIFLALFLLIKSTNFVLLYRMISALVQKKYEVHFV